MNSGYRIIRAIQDASLVRLVRREDPAFPQGYYVTLTWSSGAEEQLDALVEEMVKERKGTHAD
jgi:hypothetical protein